MPDPDDTSTRMGRLRIRVNDLAYECRLDTLFLLATCAVTPLAADAITDAGLRWPVYIAGAYLAYRFIRMLLDHATEQQKTYRELRRYDNPG